MENWIEKEFKDIDLGDKRLNKRLISVFSRFNDKPDQSINRSLPDWKDKKAAYRFFDNDKCSAEKIFSPHKKRTSERMKGHKVILSIHDTSFLNYDAHKKTTGLGNIGGKNNTEEGPQGLIFHGALGLTTEGVPLGLQHLKIFSRGEEELNWHKESERWIESFKDAQTCYDDKTKMVFITDREGDQFELIKTAIDSKQDVVIRSKHDRYIIGTDYYLSWHLKKQKKVAEVEIEDPKNKRVADVSISYSKFSFNDPKVNRAKHLARKDIDRVTLYIVEAKEENPPQEVQGLHWVLLTTLPVTNTSSALTIIDYYRKRWSIESYFKVLKKGCCDVEDCRLQTKDRLKGYLSVFSIIAWRIFWMTLVSRVDDKADASLALTEIEIKALYCFEHKTKIIPETVHMSLKDAIRSIAKLGGYNGRKGDGPPGSITLWRGWMDFQAKVEMFEVFM